MAIADYDNWMRVDEHYTKRIKKRKTKMCVHPIMIFLFNDAMNRMRIRLLLESRIMHVHSLYKLAKTAETSYPYVIIQTWQTAAEFLEINVLE